MTDSEFCSYMRIKESQGEQVPLPLPNFAPERFYRKCSEKSEVYSFGFAMFEILTRGKPSHPLEGRINFSNSTEVERYIRNEEHSPKHSIMAILHDHKHLDPMTISHQHLEPIQKLMLIFDEVWEYNYDQRETFSYLTSELRNLHNFIGRNCEETKELNFPILTKDSVHVIDDITGYSVHVRSSYFN